MQLFSVLEHAKPLYDYNTTYLGGVNMAVGSLSVDVYRFVLL